MSSRDRQELGQNWRLTRQSPTDAGARWIPVKRVPTVVHLDLMALPDGHPDKIADPYQDLNEFDARWVADEQWTYECRFRSPAHITKAAGETAGRHAARTTNLVFKGLDTVSTVTLNGSRLLDTDNMFTEYTVDVAGTLHPDPAEDNVLQIQFASARLAGLRQVQRGPRHEYHVHQTEVGRAAIRKAQYQWGWDWGPILMTCGPWQPVVLDSYDSCIDRVRVWTALSDDLAQGKVTLNVRLAGAAPAASITAEIRAPSGGTIGHVARPVGSLSPGTDAVDLPFAVPSPDLWWPAGYGRQDMYTATVSLRLADGRLLDRSTKRFGFRRSQLVQEPDDLGTSFYFRINNVDVFAGGSCWIPADSFLRRPDYRHWMRLLADSHQAMVRVWGGGIYEPDGFYDACDELGLLVWQDFAFACASYPANDEAFLRSVDVEARQNAARLQRHPSVVVWAGNNEDYQLKEHYDLQYDAASLDPQAWRKTKFPARYLYEHVLPAIVREAYGAHVGAHAVPYQPGSPYGDARSTTLKVDPSIGDIHQWNVWHGAMRPYQEYPQLGGRFVSEFGVQAYPHAATLRGAVRGDDARWPGSRAMDVRNKAVGHQFRMLKYVAENFRVRALDDPATFGHLTQVMQADAVAHAYRGWRRRWRQRRCGGALLWQLNDCWPTVSWSVVDYHGVPKPAYYAIKRLLAPLAITVQRPFHDWTTRRVSDTWQRETGHVEPRWERTVRYDVCAVSAARAAVAGCRTVVRVLSVATGQDVLPARTLEHAIEPNTTTFVAARGAAAVAGDGAAEDDAAAPDGTGDASDASDANPHDPWVVAAALYVGGALVSTDTSWPDPIKYLDFAGRGVAVDRQALQSRSLTGTVRVTADRPVKGFVFAEAAESGVRFSDNGFDVMPGAAHTVVLTRPAAGADEPWPELPYTYVGQDIWG